MNRDILAKPSSVLLICICCMLSAILLVGVNNNDSRNTAQNNAQSYYLDNQNIPQDKGKRNVSFAFGERKLLGNRVGVNMPDLNNSDRYGAEMDSKVPKSKNASDTKYILYYYGGHRKFRNSRWMPHANIDRNTCPVSNCVLTANPKLLGSHADFDAVIVRHPLYDIVRGGTKILVPDQSERKPHQRYIFYQKNTSQYLYKCKDLDFLHTALQEIKNIFNWTMTLRLDSDLPIPYGWIDPIGSPERDKPQGINEIPINWLPYDNSEIIKSYRNMDATLRSIAAKPKGIAWLVSHRNAWSRRSQYVEELQKHIDVDIYGRLGTICGHRHSDNKSDCNEIITQSYKFYLAFENSLCDDYISEKFWRAMSWDLVPIVLGDGNYAKVTPPHSHINVKDFATPKNLADYIEYLNNNDEEYLSYFWWKQHYKVALGHEVPLYTAPERPAVCDLCRRLHDPQEPLSQIQKLEELLTCRKVPGDYWSNRTIVDQQE